MAALAQFQSIDEGNGWENELALVIGDDGGVISTAQSAVVINLLRNANKWSLRSTAAAVLSNTSEQTLKRLLDAGFLLELRTWLKEAMSISSVPVDEDAVQTVALTIATLLRVPVDLKLIAQSKIGHLVMDLGKKPEILPGQDEIHRTAREVVKLWSSTREKEEKAVKAVDKTAISKSAGALPTAVPDLAAARAAAVALAAANASASANIKKAPTSSSVSVGPSFPALSSVSASAGAASSSATENGGSKSRSTSSRANGDVDMVDLSDSDSDDASGKKKAKKDKKDSKKKREVGSKDRKSKDGEEKPSKRSRGGQQADDFIAGSGPSPLSQVAASLGNSNAMMIMPLAPLSGLSSSSMPSSSSAAAAGFMLATGTAGLGGSGGSQQQLSSSGAGASGAALNGSGGNGFDSAGLSGLSQQHAVEGYFVAGEEALQQLDWNAPLWGIPDEEGYESEGIVIPPSIPDRLDPDDDSNANVSGGGRGGKAAKEEAPYQVAPGPHVGMTVAEIGEYQRMRGLGMPDRYGIHSGGILINKVHGKVGGKQIEWVVGASADEHGGMDVDDDDGMPTLGSAQQQQRQKDGSDAALVKKKRRRGIRWIDETPSGHEHVGKYHAIAADYYEGEKGDQPIPAALLPAIAAQFVAEQQQNQQESSPPPLITSSLVAVRFFDKGLPWPMAAKAAVAGRAVASSSAAAGGGKPDTEAAASSASSDEASTTTAAAAGSADEGGSPPADGSSASSKASTPESSSGSTFEEAKKREKRSEHDNIKALLAQVTKAMAAPGRKAPWLVQSTYPMRVHPQAAATKAWSRTDVAGRPLLPSIPSAVPPGREPVVRSLEADRIERESYGRTRVRYPASDLIPSNPHPPMPEPAQPPTDKRFNSPPLPWIEAARQAMAAQVQAQQVAAATAASGRAAAPPAGGRFGVPSMVVAPGQHQQMQPLPGQPPLPTAPAPPLPVAAPVGAAPPGAVNPSWTQVGAPAGAATQPGPAPVAAAAALPQATGSNLLADLMRKIGGGGGGAAAGAAGGVGLLMKQQQVAMPVPGQAPGAGLPPQSQMFGQAPGAGLPPQSQMFGQLQAGQQQQQPRPMMVGGGVFGQPQPMQQPGMMPQQQQPGMMLQQQQQPGMLPQQQQPQGPVMGGPRPSGLRIGTKPCLFFASSQGCKNGDNCRFIHDPAFKPSQDMYTTISGPAKVQGGLPGAGGPGPGIGGPAGAMPAPSAFGQPQPMQQQYPGASYLQQQQPQPPLPGQQQLPPRPGFVGMPMQQQQQMAPQAGMVPQQQQPQQHQFGQPPPPGHQMMMGAPPQAGGGMPFPSQMAGQPQPGPRPMATPFPGHQFGPGPAVGPPPQQQPAPAGWGQPPPPQQQQAPPSGAFPGQFGQQPFGQQQQPPRPSFPGAPMQMQMPPPQQQQQVPGGAGSLPPQSDLYKTGFGGRPQQQPLYGQQQQPQYQQQFPGMPAPPRPF